jgi:hypothetical protein
LAYDEEVSPLRAGAILLALVVRAYPQATPPQTQEPPAAEQPAEEYFSGIVVSCTNEAVTVARTILGNSYSSRRFAISSETQVEGKLKVKVRVTVKYVTRDEVDHALHIIVRYPAPKK